MNGKWWKSFLKKGFILKIGYLLKLGKPENREISLHASGKGTKRRMAIRSNNKLPFAVHLLDSARFEGDKPDNPDRLPRYSIW